MLIDIIHIQGLLIRTLTVYWSMPEHPFYLKQNVFELFSIAGFKQSATWWYLESLCCTGFFKQHKGVTNVVDIHPRCVSAGVRIIRDKSSQTHPMPVSMWSRNGYLIVITHNKLTDVLIVHCPEGPEYAQTQPCIWCSSMIKARSTFFRAFSPSPALILVYKWNHYHNNGRKMAKLWRLNFT